MVRVQFAQSRQVVIRVGVRVMIGLYNRTLVTFVAVKIKNVTVIVMVLIVMVM